jgi:hypothetical protein
VVACNVNKQEAIPTTTTMTPPPRTTTTTSPDPSAPPVTIPLDATDFVDFPCTSLTEEQQRQYRVVDFERTVLGGTDPQRSPSAAPIPHPVSSRSASATRSTSG